MHSVSKFSKRCLCEYSRNADSKILVLNAGSSSLKYKLFGLEYIEQEKSLRVSSAIMSGLVELSNSHKQSGTKRNGKLTHSCFATSETIRLKDLNIPEHSDALEKVVSNFLTKEDVSSIRFVGHRVVHGGEEFHKATIIDAKVLAGIKKNEKLAPLHNPPNLVGISTATNIFGSQVTQVAVFDTAFHAKMPPRAFVYALPYEMYSNFKIRRYGFHGTSHQFVAQEAARLLNRPLGDTNLITCHLGNGSSIAAIRRGICIDTSMGFTPLEGLVMGTRCGDIDPSIPSYLCSNLGISPAQVDDILNKQSGLYGLCGESDMRQIISKMKASGNTDSQRQLAFDVFVHRARKYIGAYWMQLAPRLDAIVFTAGIGENSVIVREKICQDLEFIGVEIDKRKNEAATSAKGAVQIQSKSSSIKVLVIATDEEKSIAHQTLQAATSSS